MDNDLFLLKKKRRLEKGINKPYLGVEVATYGLLSPRLEIELRSSFFFRVSYHIGHGLHRIGRSWEIQLLVSLISSE